jgi:uncharacterized damage-inducible protein DinB
MNLIDPIVMEFTHEAGVTRRLLERVPDAQLGWKPHEKSMSMARLASHIAEIPMFVGAILGQDEFNLGGDYTPTVAGSTAEILEMFDKNVAMATEMMQGQSNERLMETWRLKKGDHVLFEMPRIGVIRGIVLNHSVHHRGQLSVYVRMHNVPLPSIYGPSADEGF